MKLLKDGGYFGFIVPIAIVSTDRMQPVREELRKSSNRLEYYNFDDRPGKIFSGLEHCRSTIIIAKKGVGTNKIMTSKYNRWYTKDRPKLFDSLKTVEVEVSNGEIIPKIGTELEKKVLKRLYDKACGKRVETFLLEEETPESIKIWFHNAPQYWIHAHPNDLVPKVRYYKYTRKGDTIKISQLINEKISDHYIPLIVKKEYADVLLALLNSSLFYWWFVIFSDGRDLLLQHIASFPLDLSSLYDASGEKLTELITYLMHSYEKNARERTNVRKGGYVIVYKEYVPKLSVDLIDQIDDVLADFLDFSSEERRFIKEFDRSFRMGKNSGK